MARKQLATVYLERQPHRDAKRRLRLAYLYLIEASQAEQQADVETKQGSQEVKS